MIFQVLGLVIGLGLAAAQTSGLVTEPLPVERPRQILRKLRRKLPESQSLAHIFMCRG